MTVGQTGSEGNFAPNNFTFLGSFSIQFSHHKEMEKAFHRYEKVKAPFKGLISKNNAQKVLLNAVFFGGAVLWGLCWFKLFAWGPGLGVNQWWNF